MDAFSGTATLLRLALRRDRVALPAWGMLFLAYTVGGTAAAVALYPDLESRARAAAAINDMPALVAMYGRVWDPTSLGSVAMMKPIGFGGVFAALFGILLVTRHTRAEEESGRLELVAAQAVGRFAPLTAAMLVATGTMSVFTLVNGLGVAAAGLPATGAWAFAVSVSLTGLVFSALAAVTAQLTQSARTANVLALTALAVAFVIRGTADAGGSPESAAWWTWLSPVGWQDQVRAFAGDRFAVIALFLVAIPASVVAAFQLAAKRDFDAGLLPQRDGRRTAGRWLRSPFALAVRLQRGILTGLLLAYGILSLLLGAIVSDVDGMLDSPAMMEIVRRLGGSENLVDAFTAFEFSFVAIVTALCGVILARRFGTEEQAGRIEPLLAVALPRWRVFGAFTCVPLLGVTMLQLMLGVAFAGANGLQLGNFKGAPETIVAALAYVPAIWLVVAATFALLAVAPGFANVSWALVGGSLVISEFGPMFSWPGWILNLSPFTHVPHMPAAPMTWTPLAIQLLFTALILAGAFARYRARDLGTP